MARKRRAVSIERVQQAIHVIRHQRVMLDSDLAQLYGVETKTLNRSVKRNSDRFPERFMFQLTQQEFTDLKYQIGTSSQWGGRRKPPYAFTEHGAVMLASVLNSPTAIETSIQVVEAFVRMRHMVDAVKDLRRKITALEEKYDGQFAMVFEAIRELMEPPEPVPKGRIGFKPGNKG